MGTRTKEKQPAPENKKEVTLQKLERYWSITEQALKAAQDAVDQKRKKEAEDFLTMARCYLSDSKHFAAKGDHVLAFGAVNYAHAWLDAGARIGLFKVKDSRLFTVDD